MKNEIEKITELTAEVQALKFNRGLAAEAAGIITTLAAAIEAAPINSAHHYAHELETKLKRRGGNLLTKITAAAKTAAGTAAASRELKALQKEIAQVIGAVGKVRRFYGIQVFEDYYFNLNICVNQDFLTQCRDGIQTYAYQVKRDKAPENCYHLHIENRARTSGAKTVYRPETKDYVYNFDTTMLIREFGEDFATRYENIKDYNFELTFKAGQWQVETGKYITRKSDAPPLTAIKFLDPASKVLLATFPAEDFYAARQFCFEYSDPGKGNLRWNPEQNYAKDFLGILDYHITLNSTEGYRVLTKQIYSDPDAVHKNLEKNLGPFKTQKAAVAAANQDYLKFKKAYFADQKFHFGLGRVQPRRVFQRVHTRELVPDLAKEKYTWHQNAGGDYNLQYSGDNNIDYVVCPEGDKFRCYKIENIILYQYHADVVNHPFVESLGTASSLEKAQATCIKDIAREARRRKSDLKKFIDKTKRVLSGQNHFRNY